MLPAHRGIFSQNLRQKLKICVDKNVLKCINLKMTELKFTFLNTLVCALLCVYFFFFSNILLLSKFEIMLICVGL